MKSKILFWRRSAACAGWVAIAPDSSGKKDDSVGCKRCWAGWARRPHTVGGRQPFRVLCCDVRHDMLCKYFKSFYAIPAPPRSNQLLSSGRGITAHLLDHILTGAHN